MEAVRLTNRFHPWSGGSSVSSETVTIVDENQAARLVGDIRWYRELAKRIKA